MKLFKDKRYKTPIKVESCDGCPLEAKIPFKGYNGIVFHNKVCLGLNHRAWGTYGPELIHPSTRYADNFGGFLPDCPLEDAPEDNREVV